MGQSCSSHKIIKNNFFITSFSFTVREGWKNAFLLPLFLLFVCFQMNTTRAERLFAKKRRLWEVNTDLDHLNILSASTLPVRSQYRGPTVHSLSREHPCLGWLSALKHRVTNWKQIDLQRASKKRLTGEMQMGTPPSNQSREKRDVQESGLHWIPD